MMTEDELIEYWVPARNKLGFFNERFKASSALCKLLGHEDVYRWGSWRVVTLTDDMKRILRAIASEHGAAIVKILEIQNKCR